MKIAEGQYRSNKQQELSGPRRSIERERNSARIGHFRSRRAEKEGKHILALFFLYLL